MKTVFPATLKEVFRLDQQDDHRVEGHFGWTDVLDPNGKPYLVYDPNTKAWFLVYWVAWFVKEPRRVKASRGPKDGYKWSGSDWYDAVPKDRNDKSTAKRFGWPKPIRVFELPGVKYAPPTIYTHEGEKSNDTGKTRRDRRSTEGRGRAKSKVV